jgi:thiamine-phosphate pyrophosphorylase
MMQLYAITDRRLFSTPSALMEQAALWAAGGVDFIQIREKDLAADELATLATGIICVVRASGSRTRVLLNGPAALAAKSGCDGVHLPSGLPASAIAEAKAAFAAKSTHAIVSISCHTSAEVEAARDHGVSLILFAPVFEKRVTEETTPGQGLEALAAACRLAAPVPVFALGGITTQNAQDCIYAGAAGIAAIRLFASGDWRSLSPHF